MNPLKPLTPEMYRHLRDHIKLSQAQLGEILGVPRETISRRENGKQPINFEATYALAYVVENVEHLVAGGE